MKLNETVEYVKRMLSRPSRARELKLKKYLQPDKLNYVAPLAGA